MCVIIPYMYQINANQIQYNDKQGIKRHMPLHKLGIQKYNNIVFTWGTIDYIIMTLLSRNLSNYSRFFTA